MYNRIIGVRPRHLIYVVLVPIVKLKLSYCISVFVKVVMMPTKHGVGTNARTPPYMSIKLD